jgi:hypothetical protein
VRRTGCSRIQYPTGIAPRSSITGSVASANTTASSGHPSLRRESATRSPKPDALIESSAAARAAPQPSTAAAEQAQQPSANSTAARFRTSKPGAPASVTSALTPPDTAATHRFLATVALAHAPRSMGEIRTGEAEARRRRPGRDFARGCAARRGLHLGNATGGGGDDAVARSAMGVGLRRPRLGIGYGNGYEVNGEERTRLLLTACVRFKKSVELIEIRWILIF